ncbi:holo-ACP synthase [Spongiibacter nanhainus]|uniref:Holo-[acyl-carrier-protein] synthase n=1 Tax=Spongiibacter nanhainus TaxID=2794344 RepID=A0A7T4US94_9GAMM|nr:holo-ACP synthase [Spongiibacter nanhainus]QQD19220.1 holo-ACP synthase [Spongiibacter nanhainus]
MIVGIGTDMADIRRIEDVYSRHGDRFVRRVLNVQERQRWAEHHNPVAYLAKRYAVKEAAAKALGVGIGARAKLHDFTVSYTPVGAPQLNLSGQAKQTADEIGVTAAHVSISDEWPYALAFVVLSGLP